MASRWDQVSYTDGSVTPSRSETDYMALDEQQLVRRRDEEFARQEAALDEIHIGAQGLTHMARNINDEVVDSTQLIGDVGNRMDAAHVDLEKGEQKARLVNALKSKACKLYVVIALLVIVEILLTTPLSVDFF